MDGGASTRTNRQNVARSSFYEQGREIFWDFYMYETFRVNNLNQTVSFLLRRWLVGGNWGNGSSCGSRSVNCNNLSSNRNGNYGSRLVADTGILKTFPFPSSQHGRGCLQNPRAGLFILADKKAKNKGFEVVASSYTANVTPSKLKSETYRQNPGNKPVKP